MIKDINQSTIVLSPSNPEDNWYLKISKSIWSLLSVFSFIDLFKNKLVFFSDQASLEVGIQMVPKVLWKLLILKKKTLITFISWLQAISV